MNTDINPSEPFFVTSSIQLSTRKVLYRFSDGKVAVRVAKGTSKGNWFPDRNSAPDATSESLPQGKLEEAYQAFVQKASVGMSMEERVQILELSVQELSRKEKKARPTVEPAKDIFGYEKAKAKAAEPNTGFHPLIDYLAAVLGEGLPTQEAECTCAVCTVDKFLKTPKGISFKPALKSILSVGHCDCSGCKVNKSKVLGELGEDFSSWISKELNVPMSISFTGDNAYVPEDCLRQLVLAPQKRAV
jgi:hypothetical protein